MLTKNISKEERICILQQPLYQHHRTKIHTRIRHGQEQADSLIIHFAKEVNIKSVETIIETRFKEHRKFKKAEIWVSCERMGTYIK